ncbi:Uncharacterized protein FWK35_00004886 [Aphis craccivora]|uniref:Uncharacterized protein n=1 Tax=Aphis craccivora TaxID=307492 RepID=A0A6G0Z5C4_APHCR|nr:Uncharacterized protein FWK35_00004886 [Aphis craccivora]
MMLAANHEKPIDDHYNGRQQLLQWILFFYEISKTSVFWTNVILVLTDAIACGNFSWLCFATNKFIKTVTRLICSVFRPFRAKPLESFDKEDLIYKILLQQKLKAVKIENELYRTLWILAISLGSLIEDILADTLDFILGTRSRY